MAFHVLRAVLFCRLDHRYVDGGEQGGSPFQMRVMEYQAILEREGEAQLYCCCRRATRFGEGSPTLSIPPSPRYPYRPFLMLDVVAIRFITCTQNLMLTFHRFTYNHTHASVHFRSTTV